MMDYEENHQFGTKDEPKLAVLEGRDNTSGETFQNLTGNMPNRVFQVANGGDEKTDY